MEMKKIVMSIMLLTVTGAMNAALVNNFMQTPGMISKDIIPSDEMQKEAAEFYKEMSSLKIDKDGASVHLPADVATLAQNTLSVIPKTDAEASALETLHMAYIQIQYPYFGRDQLTKLMGGNSSFMDALKKYDAAFQAHEILYGQFWQDIMTRPDGNMDMQSIWKNIQNGDTAAAQTDLKQMMAPVTVPAKQQAAAQQDLTKLIDSSIGLKKQLTELQDLFKKTNGKLADHMAKIEYLVKQRIRWIIAMGMAINPDFKKALTADEVQTLRKTLTNLHTSPKVVAAQKQMETVHAAKMLKH